MRRTGLFLLGFGVCTLGCGPSVQSIYEGNVRFEHCYRLDLDPAIALPHREACWREWLRAYTYGQTTDRIEYARRRLLEIKVSPNLMVLRMRLAAPAPSAPAPAEATGPRTTHEAPPSTAQTAAGEGDPAAAGSASETAFEQPPVEVAGKDLPPGHLCSGRCGEGWRDCQKNCTSGRELPLCDGCAADFRRCVRRCYE